jgi:hypothetical protein
MTALFGKQETTMNTTKKTLSALALAAATLSAALVTSSIASANSGNVHGLQPVQIANPGGNVHGPNLGGNVHGVIGAPPANVKVSGLNGIRGLTPGVQSVLGGNLHVQPGPAGAPEAPQQPGQVISCHPGTGCTLTPPRPPVDRDRDHDYDRDRNHDYDYDHDRDYDHDHDHDHWHWSQWYRRGWDFPAVNVTGYAPDSCIYAYKFRTIYVPGVGLERAIVKVCEPI